MEWEFIVCLVAPALVVALFVFGGRRIGTRWLPVIVGTALALSVLSAYWVLIPLADWRPQRAWHWLPYLSLAAGIAGGVLASGYRVVALTLTLALAIWASIVLVPHWPNLWPARPVLLVILGAYFLVVPLLMVLITQDKVHHSRQFVWMGFSCLGLVVLGMAGYGLTYAKLALIGASAMLGLAVVTRGSEANINLLRASVMWFVLFSGGIAFTAGIYPQPPRFELLLMPLAPLDAAGAERMNLGSGVLAPPWRREFLAVMVWLGAVIAIAVML